MTFWNLVLYAYLHILVTTFPTLEISCIGFHSTTNIRIYDILKLSSICLFTSACDYISHSRNQQYAHGHYQHNKASTFMRMRLHYQSILLEPKLRSYDTRLSVIWDMHVSRDGDCLETRVLHVHCHTSVSPSKYFNMKVSTF
jgi:hypothetical protein